MEKILIVDDLRMNRDILKAMLEDQYEIEEAEDGMEALSVLQKRREEFSVVLLDLIMPKVDGTTVLKVMREKNWLAELPVIVISGEDSNQVERENLQLGASDYIRKPYDGYLVKMRINNVVDLAKYRRSLEHKVDEQYRLLKEQSEKLKQVNERIIDIFATVVEYRNAESGQHIQRVKSFTRIIAEELAEEYPEYGLTQHMIEAIVSASALHDLGKIAVPDSILLKPGKLTEDEFEYMKSHAARGAELLKRVEGFLDDPEYEELCYDICRHHHDKYDGKGYPDGLKGDEIPISAQIVSIADCYDALTSERVYKSAYALDKAFDMIINGECGMFSPKIISCFQNTREKLEQKALEL